MIQYIIVSVIVFFAFVLAVKKIWDSFHGTPHCGCDCRENCPGCNHITYE